MKKLFLSLLSVMLLLPFGARADEGMWLLPLMKKLNIADMKAKGLKLEAEDIYSINKSSLKDAIAIFGGGCTSELISSSGLLLTNHHCGYGAIQQHSSVEHDYLKDGFWAASLSEEIPTPGLKATFVKTITDVTDQIIPHLNDSISEQERNTKVSQLISEIVKKNKPTLKGREIIVKPFFGGNQYIMFEMEVFSDIRMVGAPPSSIGKFGGDTDNWMWPRHTGDFSLFRIYTDKDGNPSDYTAENIPMKPATHLPISLKGVKKGDFAMVLGFPGSTNRYMSSFEVSERLNQSNPIRIKARGIRQDILMEKMQADQAINIKYASKYSGSSNYWKNSIGMNKGIEDLDVIGQKKEIERRFTEWVATTPERTAEYGKALELIKKAVDGRMPYEYVGSYISETLMRGTEVTGLSSRFIPLAIQLDLKEKGMNNSADKLIADLKIASDKFYKDYDKATDKSSAKAMFKLFNEDVKAIDRPEIFGLVSTLFENNTDKTVDYIYDNTMFTSKDKVDAFFANPTSEAIANDPAIVFSKSILSRYRDVLVAASKYNDMFKKGHRLFVKGYTEMDKDVKTFYPDANFTLRMTYGQVLPYLDYDYTTHLSGVIAKEDLKNPYDFTVHPKLKELYKNRDFGRYGKKDVVVAFISDNDITGGNSGSPVINGKGELIGTAFDGNWEAMSGDIAFEPELQRCISVDIRYTLFIIDKFAGCTRLIDEMTIVD